MAKVSLPVLESLARLGHSDKALMDWLEGRLKEFQNDLMFQVDDVQLRILQGRTQELHDILELVKKAPELCRKA